MSGDVALSRNKCGTSFSLPERGYSGAKLSVWDIIFRKIPVFWKTILAEILQWHSISTNKKLWFVFIKANNNILNMTFIVAI